MSKKVAVVTGYAGFIGSTFTRRLLEEGWYVYCIDKFSYVSDMIQADRNHQEYHQRMQWIQADICELEWLPECDVIFNLAAESDVDISNQDSSKFIQTNIDGVRNLLNIINNRILIRADKPLFFQVSTDEVYGDILGGSFDESAQLNPSNPYSASKAAADFLVRSYFHTYGMNVVTTNCSNNYGPKQHDEKLIPTIIRKALSGEAIPIYGDGTNRRDWLYVLDHCKGIELVYKKGKAGETYNIGGNNERDNLYIADKICEILDELKPQKKSYKRQISFVKDRPGHDLRYAIDASKIEEELGWKADENFDTGIVKTIQWYLDKYQN